MIEILPGVFVTPAKAVEILTVLVSHIKIEYEDEAASCSPPS